MNKELDELFKQDYPPGGIKKRQIGLEFTMKCFNERMDELYRFNKNEYRLLQKHFFGDVSIKRRYNILLSRSGDSQREEDRRKKWINYAPKRIVKEKFKQIFKKGIKNKKDVDKFFDEGLSQLRKEWAKDDSFKVEQLLEHEMNNSFKVTSDFIFGAYKTKIMKSDDKDQEE